MKSEHLIMSIILVFCILAAVIGTVQIFLSPTSIPELSLADDLSLSTYSRSREDGIGVAKIYGPIYTESESTFYGFPERGCDSITRKLDNFRKDERVRAVVLRINSPGGTIGASQEITDAVLRLKDAGKKVFVSMGDVAASGGYYIAAFADKIVANKGTITGSIGVLSANVNLSELMKKYGIKMNVVKQGKNKDIFAYWRDMTPEERKIIEELSKSAYEQFLEVVSTGRNIPKNELQHIADGRIVTGEQAFQLGLVDVLGSYHETLRLVAKEVGLDPENLNVITSTDVGFQRFFEMLGQKAGAISAEVFIRQMMVQPLPVLYYCALPNPIQYLSLTH